MRCLFSSIAALTVVSACAADRADRVVDALLSQETRDAVPQRSDALAGALDSQRARWASGYVSTPEGWQPFEAVATRVANDPVWQDYQSRRGTEPLSAMQHLELDTWCGEHSLHDQERAHLWGALAFNPNQPVLWQRLGYHNVNGEWLTEQDERDAKQRRQQVEKNYRVWLNRAQALAKRLSDPSINVQNTARQQLMEIDDVAALPAFESVLSAASQESALDFVNWAKSLKCVETTLALARQAVISEWEPVRSAAIDALRSRRLDHFAPGLLGTLAMPTESSVASRNSPRRAGDVVYIYQFRREMWDTVYQGSYIVKLGEPRRIQIGAGGYLPLGRAFNTTVRARLDNDLARAAGETTENIRQAQESEEQQQAELNRRVSTVLAQVSEISLQTTPKQWWTWWAKVAAVEEQAESTKRVVEVSETEVVRPPAFMRTSSCLPPGTMILTELGGKPVDAIRIGDRVLAKDIVTGELTFRPVLHPTIRTPQPLKKLHLESDSISATNGHYFWVSGQGWRMTKELKPGDRLHGVHGTVTITDITDAEPAAVYNLVVERANTYFVGESHVLSHDVTPPSPTNVVVPGLAAR